MCALKIKLVRGRFVDVERVSTVVELDFAVFWGNQLWRIHFGIKWWVTDEKKFMKKWLIPDKSFSLRQMTTVNAKPKCSFQCGQLTSGNDWPVTKMMLKMMLESHSPLSQSDWGWGTERETESDFFTHLSTNGGWWETHLSMNGGSWPIHWTTNSNST